MHVTKIHRTLADLIYQQVSKYQELDGAVHKKRARERERESECWRKRARPTIQTNVSPIVFDSSNTPSNAMGRTICIEIVFITSKYSINQLDFLHQFFFSLFVTAEDNLALI